MGEQLEAMGKEKGGGQGSHPQQRLAPKRKPQKVKKQKEANHCPGPGPGVVRRRMDGSAGWAVDTPASGAKTSAVPVARRTVTAGASDLGCGRPRSWDLGVSRGSAWGPQFCLY